MVHLASGSSQPLLSMSTGNRNMDALVETSASHCTEETFLVHTHVDGLAALLMGEDTHGTADVIMSSSLVGAEEEPSTMLMDAPSREEAPTVPVE